MRRWRLILLWLPPIVLGIFAAVIPETFLDSPNTTIPHEGAYQIKWTLLLLGFIYIGAVFAIRFWLWIDGLAERRYEENSN